MTQDRYMDTPEIDASEAEVERRLSRQQPVDVRLAAKSYRKRGWDPIPLKPREKIPVAKGWPKQEVTEQTPWPGNIGLRLGAPSCGLVDVDLDCDEARLLAPIVLPPTGLKHGRPSSQCSHWYYACGDEAPSAASTAGLFAPGFGKGKDKALLELRSTGGQTMIPPSIHPNGEQLEWVAFGEPAEVEIAELLRAVRVLAAAALLYRHFPEQGSRELGYAAMTGTLLRAGVPVATVEGIVSRFTDFTDADQPRTASDRIRRVAQLASRLDKNDGKVPGLPKLAEVFGKDVAKRVREWLFGDADWAVSKGRILRNALHNILLALERFEVQLRFDEFAGKCLVKIGDAAEAELSDQVAKRLWFQIEEEFAFSPDWEKFCRALEDKAWQNRFHPVRDYLAGLHWDGQDRLNKWLFDYGGIPRVGNDDDRYIEAVGRLLLVAAVRRVRQPGCKFDEMLVLINETQGARRG